MSSRYKMLIGLTFVPSFAHCVSEVTEFDVDRRPLGQVGEGPLLGGRNAYFDCGRFPAVRRRHNQSVGLADNHHRLGCEPLRQLHFHDALDTTSTSHDRVQRATDWRRRASRRATARGALWRISPSPARGLRAFGRVGRARSLDRAD